MPLWISTEQLEWNFLPPLLTFGFIIFPPEDLQKQESSGLRIAWIESTPEQELRKGCWSASIILSVRCLEIWGSDGHRAIAHTLLGRWE